MDLHRRYSPASGYTHIIGPGPETGLRYIDLGVLRLGPGETYSGETGNKELALVMISGKCDVKTGDVTYKRVGTRNGLSSGKPSGVFLPSSTSYTITGATQMEAAIAEVLALHSGEPAVIRPADVFSEKRGRANYLRTVHYIVHNNVPASRIQAGESHPVRGGWAFPPHKHDVDNPPQESRNEEVYFFKVDPPGGFGVMPVYDGKDLNETFTVRNNDVIAVPYGYHPVGAAPGCDVSFVWFMAGEKRIIHPNVDPAFSKL